MPYIKQSKLDKLLINQVSNQTKPCFSPGVIAPLIRYLVSDIQVMECEILQKKQELVRLQLKRDFPPNRSQP